MSNIIHDKTFSFAVRIVNLVRYLQKEQKEFIVSNQLLRCGTAVGAMVREAEHAQSKKDFISKMSIGLKEINETNYWLRLMHETKIVDDKQFQSLQKDCLEILRITAKIVKTSKENNAVR